MPPHLLCQRIERRDLRLWALLGNLRLNLPFRSFMLRRRRTKMFGNNQTIPVLLTSFAELRLHTTGTLAKSEFTLNVMFVGKLACEPFAIPMQRTLQWSLVVDQLVLGFFDGVFTDISAAAVNPLP